MTARTLSPLLGRALTVALALASVASTSAAQATRPSGIDTSTFDRSVRPQDDLFRYVNGGWIKRTPIPSDAARWGAADELYERSLTSLRAIFEDAGRSSAPAGSEER